MKVNYVKLTAGVLTGFMALSSVPYAVYAAGPTAGVASYTSDIVSTSNTLTAGVTSMLTDVMLKGDDTSETATDVAATDAEPVKSAYADTAVAQVSDSVNIRASADENSESLGKLYNNGIGTVLETTDNGWYKIQSGSVTGYVKGDYVVVGDDALVQSADVAWQQSILRHSRLEQQHLLMQKYLVSCPERMISQLWMSQQLDG